MPAIFSNVYGESAGIGGLNYLALGIGVTLTSQLNARYMDRIYIHFRDKNNGVGEPEFRVRKWTSLAIFAIKQPQLMLFSSIYDSWSIHRTSRRTSDRMGCREASALGGHRPGLFPSSPSLTPGYLTT